MIIDAIDITPFRLSLSFTGLGSSEVSSGPSMHGGSSPIWASETLLLPIPEDIITTPYSMTVSVVDKNLDKGKYLR
jgi:hypothetical protein